MRKLVALLICSTAFALGAAAPDSATGQDATVEFTDAEIEKLATVLGKITALAPDKWKQRDKLYAQRDKLLAQIEKSGRKPLKAISSWTKVYQHPKHTKRTGRSGRKMNQKATFPLPLGGEAQVVYHTITPSSYRGKEAVACVLCLHPLESKMTAADYLRQFYASKDVQERVIQFAPEAPGSGKNKKKKKDDGPFSWSERKKLYHTLGILGRNIMVDFNVDRNAIFLDGYGDSAVEAWKLYSQFGDVFAGLIVRGALPPAETRFEDFLNARVLLVGVPGMDLNPARADEIGAKLKKAGCDVTVIKLNEAAKPRQERDSFTQMDEALAKFFEARRTPYPAKLDWSIKESNTRSSFWMRSAGSEVEASALSGDAAKAPPSFQAAIDREKNRIEVKTHRLTKLFFNFNHAMLDLDKPLTIVVNGKVLFTGAAEPKIGALYESFELAADATRLYTWGTLVELPEEMYAPQSDKDAKDKAKPAADSTARKD